MWTINCPGYVGGASPLGTSQPFDMFPAKENFLLKKHKIFMIKWIFHPFNMFCVSKS